MDGTPSPLPYSSPDQGLDWTALPSADLPGITQTFWLCCTFLPIWPLVLLALPFPLLKWLGSVCLSCPLWTPPDGSACGCALLVIYT